MRLAQYISRSGLTSRRKAELMITSGLVKVNGAIVTRLSQRIDSEKDQVSVNGELIKPEKWVYLLMNKPKGYLSSVGDHRGRPTVVDLIKDKESQLRLYPVGRLDLDTTGLLILTNDGGFTNKMTHPRYQIPKTYQAWVSGRPTEEELNRLRRGIRLTDGMTASAKAKLLKVEADRSLVKLVLYEGRKRQVKRMFREIGHPVLDLTRSALGFLNLTGLALGQYRQLRTEEVDGLMALALPHRD